MGEYDVGLVACDIDGCLNRGKTHTLDVKTLAQLISYNTDSAVMGTPVLTLISGRPQPFVEAYANLLGVNSPCICENGALAYLPGEDRVLIHEAITPETLAAVLVCRDRLRRKIVEGLPAAIEVGKEVCTSLNPLRAARGNVLTVEALHDIVAGEIDADLFEVTHSASAVDVTPKGVNKATGLAWLSQLCGIGPSNMIGIGDAAGDLPFLGMVGYAGAPANASEAVKKQVMYVSKKEYVEGVMDVIRYFLAELSRDNDESERHRR